MSFFSGWQRWTAALSRGIWILAAAYALAASNLQLREPTQLVRRYTRPVEFDFFGWTIGAVSAKTVQWSLGSGDYLSPEARVALALEFVDGLRRASELEGQLRTLLGDPGQIDREARAAPLMEESDALQVRQAELQPLFEAILGEQISSVLIDLGLGLGGRIFPPVAFHLAHPPQALIISPREVIRQEANVQLNPDLSLQALIELERQAEQGLDVSALAVPIGGVGTYPTMILESSALAWLLEVAVHEWVHNYLTFRPLGIYYGDSADTRTMNETTASILGKEIGRRVLERYYPELVPPPPRPASIQPETQPASFDFREQMRETRLEVDRLLAEGLIEQAETYMEQRRQLFWQHGYPIRRLNQAYFAFYGAYADEPGGAAGEDPVGEGVRRLWSIVQDPAAFLRKMAWMRDLSDLERELAKAITQSSTSTARRLAKPDSP